MVSLTREELRLLGWRKARRSMGNGDCVEAALSSGHILIRDSKDTDGPVLGYWSSSWRRFTGEAKKGQYDTLHFRD